MNWARLSIFQLNKMRITLIIQTKVHAVVSASNVIFIDRNSIWVYPILMQLK